MSKTGCPATSTVKKFRFKGVENFLKRVAYNLGNSPSQTDVKIISCIPIDVSDLQQKIICLEKQLEETKCFRIETPQQRPIINTAICECPLMSTAVSCNMLDIDRSTSPCAPCRTPRPHHKRCFKKKSNVSFAVPCEKTTPCACVSPSEHRNTSDYPQTEKCFPDPPCDIYDNCCSFMGGDSKSRGCRKNLFIKKNKCCKFKKPKAQYVYYAQTRSTPFNTTTKQKANNAKRVMSRTYLTEMLNKQYTPRPLGGNLSEISNFSAPICRDGIDFNRPIYYESDLCSCFHEGYQNIDKHLNAGPNPYIISTHRLNTESRYYDSTLYDVFPVKEKPVKVRKPSDITKKRELKNWIDVRKPTDETLLKVSTYPKNNPFYRQCQTLSPNTESILSKMEKIKRRDTIPTRFTPKCRNRMSNIDREIKMQESKSCCIEFRSDPLYPKTINIAAKADKSLEVIQETRKSDAECITRLITSNDCQTGTSIGGNDSANIDNQTENTLNEIKSILQSVLQEVKVTSISKCSTDGKVNKDADMQKDIPQRTNDLQESKGDNIHGNIPGNIQGNKITSVLGNMTESQQSNVPYSFSGAVPTKMQIPAHMQESRFLNSITYSHYNNGSCMPCCSKQLNTNSYYYTPPPLKYFLNYPVYVQSPERNMCTSCYRHNSHIKPQYHKQAATIATNTDQDNEKPRKETNTLIKELYKSIAMNMDVNNKHISSSAVDTAQKVVNNANQVEKSKKVGEFKNSANVVRAVSEIFRKEILISSESPNSTTINSQEESVDISIHSSSEIKSNFDKKRRNNFNNLPNYNRSEAKPQDNSSTTENSTMTSATDTSTDSEVTLVSPKSEDIQRSPREKKEKVGLFSKMFKSVFKQKEKKNKKGNSVETLDTEELSSDSDDYQTIYSQKIQRPLKYTPKTNFPKRRTHSKISYNKQTYQTERVPANITRRSPYMEQEYRRYWDEKLMFHDDRHRQSSEVPTYSYDYSSETRPVYCQRYETRTAVIQPKKVVARPLNARRIVSPKEQKLVTGQTATGKGVAWLKNCKLECNKRNIGKSTS